MKFIIGDTETTGGPDPQGVCEIAWIEVDADFQVIERVSSLIDPQKRVYASAIGIHGIYPEELVDAPTISEFFNELYPGHFSHEPVVLVGHKVAFDEQFFRPFIPDLTTICTLRLARRFLLDAEDYKLSTLKAQYRLDGGTSHRALGDCETCLSLLKLIQRQEDRPVFALHREAQKPILVEKMPFGKHKDQPIKSIDKSYIRWALANLKELDIDLKYTLEQAIA